MNFAFNCNEKQARDKQRSASREEKECESGHKRKMGTNERGKKKTIRRQKRRPRTTKISISPELQ